jgi:uncharacterized pyridoxamine 5'-phosphate oxidase family protein
LICTITYNNFTVILRKYGTNIILITFKKIILIEVKKMSDIEKVDEMLTKAEVFYLATVNENKPKVRPLGFHLLYEDKIYFGVGTFKEVYKQLEANQFTEIAAWDGEHFLRYYGEAVLEKNEDVVEKAFELMPEIAETYKADNWEMGVFYLDKATAEIRNMMAVEETYTFEY